MSSSKIIKGEHFSKTEHQLFTLKNMNAETPDHENIARQEAEAILRKARQEKESIEMEAYNRGLEQGQEQGQKIAIKKLEPVFEAFEKALQEVAKLREQLTSNHSEQILKLIYLIAEKVIQHEISITPETILETVKQASNHLMETDEIRVRLNPSDYEYIQEIEAALGRRLSGHKTIHFIDDSGLSRGDMIIETKLGDIDATIQSQIEHIRASIFENE